MEIQNYHQKFSEFFDSQKLKEEIKNTIVLIKKIKRIFFIGNGGSNAICSHMAEDFSKIAKIPSLSFSDAALITCYSNDYGYENAIAEWLEIHFQEDDMLIALSSSGNSDNIVNAAKFVKKINGKIVTLTGFNKNNKLSSLGDINIHIDNNRYGIVECFHEVILHSIVDTLQNE